MKKVPSQATIEASAPNLLGADSLAEWIENQRKGKKKWTQEQLITALKEKTGDFDLNRLKTLLKKKKEDEQETEKTTRSAPLGDFPEPDKPVAKLKEIQALADIFEENVYRLAALANLLHPHIRKSLLYKSEASNQKRYLSPPVRIVLPLSIASIPFAHIKDDDFTKRSPYLYRYEIIVKETSHECMQAMAKGEADIALVTQHRFKVWSEQRASTEKPAKTCITLGETVNDKTTDIFKLFAKPNLVRKNKNLAIGYLKNSIGKSLLDVLRENLVTDNEKAQKVSWNGEIERKVPVDSIHELAENLKNGNINAFIGWFPLRAMVLHEITKLGIKDLHKYKVEIYGITDTALNTNGTGTDQYKRNFIILVNSQSYPKKEERFQVLQHFYVAFSRSLDKLKAIKNKGEQEGSRELLTYLSKTPGFTDCSLEWLETYPFYHAEIKKRFFSLIKIYDFDIHVYADQILDLRDLRPLK